MKIVSGASGAAHWSGCSLPPHRIDVEGIIAYLPQRRFVVLAIDGDVAGGALDLGRGARVQRELIVPIELGKEVSRRRPFVGRAAKKNGGGHARSSKLSPSPPGPSGHCRSRGVTLLPLYRRSREAGRSRPSSGQRENAPQGSEESVGPILAVSPVDPSTALI